MKLEGPALRLTVLVGETDQWHHHPVYTEVVGRAHAAALEDERCSVRTAALHERVDALELPRATDDRGHRQIVGIAGGRSMVSIDR